MQPMHLQPQQMPRSTAQYISTQSRHAAELINIAAILYKYSTITNNHKVAELQFTEA